MGNRINVKKSVLKRILKEGVPAIAPGWLTNFHWAVRIEALPADLQFLASDRLRLEGWLELRVLEKNVRSLDSVLPSVPAEREFLRARDLVDIGDKQPRYARKFVCDDGAEVFVQEIYVQAFGLTCLYGGDSNGTLWGAKNLNDISFIIATCNPLK